MKKKADLFLSEDEVANELKVKKTTLYRHRCEGRDHPPFVKLNGKALYPKHMFIKWLNGKMCVQAVDDSNKYEDFEIA